MLGPTPSITHKGDNRYKTFFGALLTFFTFIVCLMPYLINFVYLFTGDHPTIDSNFQIISFGNITFNHTKDMKLFFQLEYLDIKSLTFKSINMSDYPKFNIKLYNDESVQTVLNRDQKEFPNTNLIKCPNSMFDDYANYVKSNGDNYNYDKTSLTNDVKGFLESSICFPEYLDETLFWKSNNNDFLNTQIKIQNSMALNVERSLISNLKEKYNTSILNLVINHSTKVIDTYSGILKTIIAQQKFIFDYENYQEINIELKKNAYARDDSVFVLGLNSLLNGNLNYKKYLEISSLERVINIPYDLVKTYTNDCLVIKISSSDIYQENVVKNLKIENLFSDMGGLIGLIFPLMESICGLILSPFYNASKVNSVFKFHSNIESNKDIEYYLKLLVEIKKASDNNYNNQKKKTHSFENPDISSNILNINDKMLRKNNVKSKIIFKRKNIDKEFSSELDREDNSNIQEVPNISKEQNFNFKGN